MVGRKRLAVEQVFTPRRAEVNPEMYVSRPHHERALSRAIRGSLHAIVCGESGSGKSWLYKKVAKDEGWKLFSVNFANAAREKSITAAIGYALLPSGTRELEKLEQSINATGGALVVGGGAESSRTYSVASTELLERAFSKAREVAGRRRKVVLVLDNLEAVFTNDELLQELGNIILLLDDERYAQYQIKILIVGVPANLIEYFQRMPNLEPVANRIRETPPVQALEREQVDSLVERGFRDLLRVSLEDEQLGRLSRHIYRSTLGIASRVQEYCEQLGYVIEDAGWWYGEECLSDADDHFVQNALIQAYSVVDRCMNDKETRTGRRNQVLYALSKIDSPYFDPAKVESVLKREFPDSTEGVQLGVPQILSDLASEGRRLLRRSGRGATYRFEDPRYLMCSRLILRKTVDEKVVKRLIKR